MAVECVNQPAVCVAAHPDCSPSQFGKSFQGLRWHGSIGNVAVKHDHIDPDTLDVEKHRFKGWRIAVNIGKHRSSHVSVLPGSQSEGALTDTTSALRGDERQHISRADLIRALPTTLKNTFKSYPAASTVFGRHRPPRNFR
jgi:hypothetical protein